MESMSHLSPMLETYVQNMKPDNELGLVPASDEYFLGKLDFGKCTYVAIGVADDAGTR